MIFKLFNLNFVCSFFYSSVCQAITLAKTCEATTEMRECRVPRDWSLLALQNVRTGKSHYLVICKCPDKYNLGKFQFSSGSKGDELSRKCIEMVVFVSVFFNYQRVQWHMISQHTQVCRESESSA